MTKLHSEHDDRNRCLQNSLFESLALRTIENAYPSIFDTIPLKRMMKNILEHQRSLSLWEKNYE